MSETRERPIWVYITKGSIAAVIAILIKYLTSLSCLAVYSQDSIVSDIPNFAVCIVVFIASLFIYNSVFGLLFSFDRLSADEFLKKNPTRDGEKTDDERSTFRMLYEYKSFILTAAPIVLITSVAAGLGVNWEIPGMFYFGEGKSPFSKGIIPFIATLIIISAYMLFERFESIRYWKMLKRQGNLDELTSKPRIIFRVLVVLIAYPLMLPYLPMIAFVLISFLSTLAMLITAPVLGAIAFGFILAILAIRILITFKRRKKAIKAITTIIREHGYEMSKIKNPYASLLSRKKLCTFTFKNKRNTFDCLIIGHFLRGIPICFTSESDGYYRYMLGTKRHNITMQKHFTYSADGDGKKIMIINPTPKQAYLVDTQTGKEKRVYNADLVWNFVAYEVDAFVGALDRDCLGRHTSVAEGDAGVKVPSRLPIRHGMNRFS